MAVLLIPGLNADARVFRAVTEALWATDGVMVANHLGGEGMAEIARRILADAPPTFALAGFSFGGYLAFEILRQAAERVTHLALIDTSARPDTSASTETRRQRIAQTRAGKFSLVVQQSFANSVHPDHQQDDTLKSLHSGMALSNGPDAYVRHQEAIIGRPDSLPLLASIAVPTIVIVGEADQITPPEVATEMHSGIAGSRLAVIPKAGHLALLEQPDAVVRAFDGWLRN
ncbi:MAG: alpha/beta fold hydrolase [Devosia sp.]